MIDIVIPFFKDYDTIEDLLRSIEDQDYKLHNTYVVVDGPDDKAHEVLDSLKGLYIFHVHQLNSNQGASAARNYGASLGEAPVLFFIDADCVLYPGILREAMTNLDDNKDVDFVYGNYRFEHKKDYFSRPFNPHMLKTMNYISTMSPVRRKAFEKAGGFIEGQPFFQDWSLFYRLADAGHKGLFLPEFLFSTKVSSEDNISGSQGLSLAEKAEMFRLEHGIAHNTLVASTFGAPLQAEQRAVMLDADYAGNVHNSNASMFPVNLAFDNWKATYMVGAYNAPFEALINHYKACKGKPIFHFIGRDVLQLQTGHSFLELKELKRLLDEMEATVLVNSENAKAEMEEMGIDADLVYTPVANMDKFQPGPLPKKFTVGVYYSDNPNLNFFDTAEPLNDLNGQSNIPFIFDIARSMPTVQFKFFGGQYKEKFKNIEFCGRIPSEDMPEFINSCSMILRSTVHDGFPQLPIQFMLSGRAALVSYPGADLQGAERLSFERVFHNFEAKEETIRKIYEIRDKGQFPDSEKLRAYYKELMDEEVYKEKVRSYVPE